MKIALVKPRMKDHQPPSRPAAWGIIYVYAVRLRETELLVVVYLPI